MRVVIFAGSRGTRLAPHTTFDIPDVIRALLEAGEPVGAFRFDRLAPNG